jgi:hypothetical protein
VVWPNQIPRVDEIVVPGVAALKAARPSAASFIDSNGFYAKVIAGWKAQARIAVAYLADQVISCRIGSSDQPMARGKALSELCRSEWDTDREAGPVAAVGTAYLTRPNGGAGGAIPFGFRFRRDGNTSSIPPVPAALYTATADVPVKYQASGAQQIQVPIIASQPGAASNAPVFQGEVSEWTLGGTTTTAGPATFTMVDTPFDPTIALVSSDRLTSYEASGGLDSEDDNDLIAQAVAYASGQYGPVLGAILAGALRGTGAHRVLVKDIYNWDQTVAGDGLGGVAAVTGVCIADASWAAGPAWVAQTQQSIADNFQGFGQLILVTGVLNIAIRVDCAVTVRDANSLSDVSGLTTKIQAAVRSYFDDRPDWYMFRNSSTVFGGLRAAIAAADRRILTCTSALVYEAYDGTLINQPASAVPFAIPNGGLKCIHWMLVQNGVTVVFSAPL